MITLESGCAIKLQHRLAPAAGREFIWLLCGVQAMAGNPGGKGFLGLRLWLWLPCPIQRRVWWQQAMLWSPSGVSQLAEHICPGTAGTTAVLWHIPSAALLLAGSPTRCLYLPTPSPSQP